ncbi:MAG: polyphosphate--glucose phosphotransferase [Microthrixaceae bacterium]
MSSTDPDAHLPIGVDIGGTGVKAALVDLSAGTMASERERIDTPHPATPEAVADVVAELLKRLGGAPHIGITVPAAIRSGVVLTAANIDQAWLGIDAVEMFADRLGQDCVVLNDADAAGIAEMRFGAGEGRDGVVMVVTLGTGIGTALFTDGVLVPNTELGHLELKGHEAEKYASGLVRETEDLSWHQWGHRVGHYLDMVDKLFWPDLIIVGGGVSKRFEKFSGAMRDKMDSDTEVVAAHSLNAAGIVGAALAATAPDRFHTGADGSKPDTTEEDR